MDDTILERAMNALRDAGIDARAAYCGQKLPAIGAPVAAVHMETLDCSARTLTLAVGVHTPASLGGTLCERTAAQIALVLGQIGGVCKAYGCTYDAMARHYLCRVEACFSEAVEPGFTVSINEKVLSGVVGFSVQCERQMQELTEIGEDEPSDISGGRQTWKLTLIHI